MTQKLAFFLFTISILLQCQKKFPSGTVVKVADGDTFTILTDQNEQIRVRLHGIDAPEKGQDFSQVSKQYLTDMVLHKTVELISTKKDQYGRVVAVVNVDQLIVNEEMLKAGLAWHYKEHDKNQGWHEMELAARRGKLGLWSQRDPVPPWQFRKEKRKIRQK